MAGGLSPDASGYINVNGLDMYYETYGAGDPLILLHGALSATQTSFGELIPGLARSRRLIAIEPARRLRHSAEER